MQETAIWEWCAAFLVAALTLNSEGKKRDAILILNLCLKHANSTLCPKIRNPMP